MEYTTNLNLKKPDVNEYYDIEKNNENMDLIDTAVGELNSQVGTETLTTTAQDCTGAINELNKKCTVISANGSPNAIYGEYVEIASISLKGGHTYLIVGGGDNTIADGTGICGINVAVIGESTVYGVAGARTSMAGGGGTTINFVAVCKTDCVFTLKGYGSVNKTYKYRGGISGILLQ